MNVGLYIDGSVPGFTTVFGAHNSPNVHVDIKRAVRVSQHRSDIRRAAPWCKPRIPSFCLLEWMDRLQNPVS